MFEFGLQRLKLFVRRARPVSLQRTTLIIESRGVLFAALDDASLDVAALRAIERSNSVLEDVLFVFSNFSAARLSN